MIGHSSLSKLLNFFLKFLPPNFLTNDKKLIPTHPENLVADENAAQHLIGLNNPLISAGVSILIVNFLQGDHIAVNYAGIAVQTRLDQITIQCIAVQRPRHLVMETDLL